MAVIGRDHTGHREGGVYILVLCLTDKGALCLVVLRGSSIIERGLVGILLTGKT